MLVNRYQLIKRLFFFFILFTLTLPLVEANERKKNFPELMTAASMQAYDETLRVITDGLNQIKAGKKEITLQLNLDEDPKTLEKIVVSPSNFYKIQDLIQKQVDQSMKEIQKNTQTHPPSHP